MSMRRIVVKDDGEEDATTNAESQVVQIIL